MAATGRATRVSRDAQVYVATIRDVLADQPPPDDPDVLPVVYVVGVGETTIPADVQAAASKTDFVTPRVS